MADSASAARPYAKALFELAQEGEAFDQWGQALTKLSAIAMEPSFAALVNDPKVSQDSLLALLTELMGNDLPAGGDNFLQLVLKNQRVGALADIAAQFEALVAAAQSTLNAQVHTAMALTDEQRQALTQALETRLGLSVVLEEIVEPTLIGGAIVKAGDLVIDGSAQGRLEKLTTALMR